MENPTVFPLVKDIVLACIAVYGAVLSTINWYSAVKKERRSLSVRTSTAMATYDSGQLGHCMCKLEVANVGHRPVTVSFIALELPGGKRMFPTGDPDFPEASTSLPVTLPDGQTARLVASYRGIGTVLADSGFKGKVKIIPLCEDSAGGTHRGKAMRVDPHEWASM